MPAGATTCGATGGNAAFTPKAIRQPRPSNPAAIHAIRTSLSLFMVVFTVLPDQSSGQFEELAFCFLICNSLTTCSTLGTPSASFCACLRVRCESTSPVSVTE